MNFNKIKNTIKKYKFFLLVFLLPVALVLINKFLPTPQKASKTLPSPSPQQQKLPLPSDFAGDALKQAVKEKPWLLDMPVREDNYTIDYLESTNTFRVLIEVDIASNLTREQQISRIKSEAPQELRQLGIQVEKYNIDYNFSP